MADSNLLKIRMTEPELEVQLREYSQQKGFTVSGAVRHLVRLGLKMEALYEATVQKAIESGRADQSSNQGRGARPASSGPLAVAYKGKAPALQRQGL